jgi:hypothetical protein
VQLFTHILGPLFQRWVGEGPIFGGMLLGLGGWCFEYAVRTWGEQKVYAVIMWAMSAALFAAVFYWDFSAAAYARCVVMGLLYYLLLRQSIRAREPS